MIRRHPAAQFLTLHSSVFQSPTTISLQSPSVGHGPADLVVSRKMRLHILTITMMIGCLMGEEPKGIIGRAFENDMPVIYKFVNEMPGNDVRSGLKCLLVVSWKYDGSKNNGMPTPDENNKMIKLEDIIEEKIEVTKKLRHVYSRTGNNLKELVYYIEDNDKFLEIFNKVMANQERVPIEINFYKDPEWSEFSKLLKDFSRK